MATRSLAAPLIRLGFVWLALASNAAWAADLTADDHPGTCQTVFTGSPVPPYFTRYGCIHNVITVHRLPESSRRPIVLHQRDVVIEPPLLIDVYE